MRISDPSLIANGPLLSPSLTLPAAQPEYPMTIPPDGIMLNVARSSYTIQDAHVAHVHAARLLLILAEMLSAIDVQYEAGLDYTAWVLDTMLFLLDVKRKWNFDRVAQNSNSNFCLPFLRTIQSIKVTAPAITPVTIMCKYYMVTAKVFVECLEESAMLSDDFITDIMCPSLLELASICKKFEPVSEIVKSKLLPILLNLSAGDNAYFIKHKDFKVRPAFPNSRSGFNILISCSYAALTCESSVD